MTTNVNVPTNPAKRDKDINTKLQVYGIFQAFANGKLPSNQQIDVALSSFTNHKKLKNPNEKLSDEGKVLLEDFRNVVDEAKRLLLTKNHDQALQQFIYTTTQLGQKGGPQTGTPDAPLSKDEASRDGDKALEGLKVLGRLMITNGQFRKLINDAGILLRDIASDAAAKSAGSLRPDQERLNRLDDPAPDHEWHDAPDFSTGNIKGQLRDTFNKKAPVNEQDLREVAGNATQAAHPQGSRDPHDLVNQAAQEQRQGVNTGMNLQAGLHQGAAELVDRVDQNIPEDQKDRAREYRERTNRYMKNKIPKERREQTIWRLKKMVVEIQSHPDYHQAIDTLLMLAEQYSSHGKNVAGQTQGTVKSAHKDSNLKQAEHQLKILLERFANNTSFDDLLDAINDIYRDADRDPDLKNWFKSIDSFIRRVLKTEGYIITDDATREYNLLYDHGNFLLRNRYREHTDRLINEFKFIGEQFAEDPDNNRFGDAMEKLFHDLGTDENGNAAFKKHLVDDITRVIIPDIFENVRYVPVPRLEYTDNQVDAVIENLVIESDNLMPNVLEIGTDTFSRFGRKSISSTKSSKVMVSASGIQADLRDVSYYIKKKKGFPSLTDIGVADISLGGEGFGFKLQLATADKKDRARFFKVDACSVTVSHLKIKLKQSKHKALFGIFKPLLMAIVKPVIVKVLEKEIRNSFGKLDALAWRVQQEQLKAKRELKANPDPDHAVNMYQRYYQAVQKEVFDKKKKAEKKLADKKANMAVTQNDSMFKDIKLPGGISSKATEYQEKARAGDSWENEIFSIGSASPTSGLPKPAEIKRRSPHAHRAVVKDHAPQGAGYGAGAPYAGAPGSSRDSGYENSGALGAVNGAPMLNAGHVGAPVAGAPPTAGYANAPAAAGYAGAPAGYNGVNPVAKPPAPAGYENEAGLPQEAVAYSRY